MFLYGKNSVWERLKANPSSIRKVILQENFRHPQIERLIKDHRLVCERVSERELINLKHAKDLQGIVAKVDEFVYTDFAALLQRDKAQQTTLIFLDRINDPQNLGVIIRLAACFGGFAVVIPNFQACAVTEAVLHVASGGENYVAVAMVANLTQALLAARKQGYWLAGALVSESAKDIRKVNLPFPLAVVLGSEGAGIRYGLEKHLDMQVRIPMTAANLSFNVSMACAIFCYEITRQREAGK